MKVEGEEEQEGEEEEEVQDRRREVGREHPGGSGGATWQVATSHS